jgi:hypothetical protein
MAVTTMSGPRTTTPARLTSGPYLIPVRMDSVDDDVTRGEPLQRVVDVGADRPTGCEDHDGPLSGPDARGVTCGMAVQKETIRRAGCGAEASMNITCRCSGWRPQRADGTGERARGGTAHGGPTRGGLNVGDRVQSTDIGQEGGSDVKKERPGLTDELFRGWRSPRCVSVFRRSAPTRTGDVLACMNGDHGAVVGWGGLIS